MLNRDSFRLLMAPGLWLPTLFVTVLIVLSLDLGHLRPEYRADIAPVAGQEGSVSVVFYGKHYDQYLEKHRLTVPSVGWQVVRGTDSTTLTAKGAVEPVSIVTDETPVNFGLLQHPKGGTAVLGTGTGNTHQIQLYSETELITPKVIGGPSSSVPPSRMAPRYSLPIRLLVSVVVFGLLSAIALMMGCTRSDKIFAQVTPSYWEMVAYVTPLLLTTGATLLAFFPGNVSYDGSLQWVQAASRGELFSPLGYPTTYFMRLFTKISFSPFPLILLQSLMAALGVALVLRELRYRGVPFLATFAVVLITALTPQYPTFFTNLGKDPLSLVGTLFFAWALLAVFRHHEVSRIPFGLLIALVSSALFGGLMRSNAMPVILVIMVLALSMLYRRNRAPRLAAAGLVFLGVTFALPMALTVLANQEVEIYEKPAARVRSLSDADLPMGVFSNLYIYHIFSAAIANGIQLPPEDAALFFAIAPREAWEKYECHMTDATFSSVSRGILLDAGSYKQHLQMHQVAMAQAVLQLILKHPSLLVDRQTCITSLLWHTGVGQKPFQATTMLGYDVVDKRFPTLAGETRSLWLDQREAFHTYLQWTEDQDRFWLFWKPALPLFIGFFIVGLYVFRTKDHGVMLTALLPLFSASLLLLIIPFPAYRYAYPSVLLLTLLGTLIFARPPKGA